MLSDRDLAIEKAVELFAEKQATEIDLSNGPCLAEEVIPDWCVDIAHWPREPIDDLPENQCRSYREGRVHHFVELDTDGNVIRVQ